MSGIMREKTAPPEPKASPRLHAGCGSNAEAKSTNVNGASDLLPCAVYSQISPTLRLSGGVMGGGQ